MRLKQRCYKNTGMPTNRYVFRESKDGCFMCTYPLWSALGLVWWETSRRCVGSTGSTPWRWVWVVTKRFWLKKSKPTGLGDAHHWSSHLWSRPTETFISGLKCIPRGSSVPVWFYRGIRPVTLLSPGTWCSIYSTFHCRNGTNLKLWNATNPRKPLK